MRVKKQTVAVTIAMAFALAGCTATSNPPVSATPPSPPQQTSSPAPSAPAPSASTSASVVGTVIRFTAGTDTVDVTIGEDSPATRDFLGMLPLTLTLKEFNGREKIADLPHELNYEGSPGSDPEDGDLIYYTPWHNLGFYYNASGTGHSEQTIHIGRYDATAGELARFEGQKTTVEILDGP
ncbi:cyclophilin-like fold protein [Arthrobacter sp. ok362]|uniref:cyclophilin-like fold protein n=1 Tax=Arthrobacter sp. ok362 TaxID=1761745 RepID=UPI00087EE3D4|nr:cyclophilin-like fold protein [Arthrobacter sp. ok362]SDL32905.1 hypothetical protein SAMN04487913_108108 [Arthrobacter sp. ok362]